MTFTWDEAKNRWLIANRGISFERIVVELEEAPMRVLQHPNPDRYPDQGLYVIDLDGYAWVVPHEVKKESIRLITAFPSRKMNKEKKP